MNKIISLKKTVNSISTKRMCPILLTALSIMPIDAFAQDVIVKKNGSTILAKVLTVGEDEVEYKKHNKPEGPTYKISVSKLLSINYEGGDKETFEGNAEGAESSKESETDGIVIVNADNMSPQAKEANTIALANFNEEKIVSFPQTKKEKSTAFAAGYFKATKESVLANEEIEVSFVTGVFDQRLKKWDANIAIPYTSELPGIQFSVKNKTNMTIYLDLGNTFYVRLGTPVCYYVPSSTSTSHSSSGGLGLNVGAVASALGIGGVIGTLANGVNVGGGSTNGTTNTVYAQRVIAIPPKSSKSLDFMYMFGNESINVAPGFCYKPWGVSMSNFRPEVYFQKQDEMHKGDHYKYQESDAQHMFSFTVTYSTTESISHPKALMSSYYLAGLVGLGSNLYDRDKYQDKTRTSIAIKVKNGEKVSFRKR